jgi:hypothetical protein
MMFSTLITPAVLSALFFDTVWSQTFLSDLSFETTLMASFTTDSPATESTCTPDCSMYAWNASKSWQIQPYIATWTRPNIDTSSTVIGATVVQIVNTDLDITQTSTIWNTGQVSNLPLNENGTRTRVVTYTRDGTQSITEM